MTSLKRASLSRTKIAVTRISELVAVQWGWFCFAWASKGVSFSKYPDLIIMLKKLIIIKARSYDNESTNK